MNDPRTRPTDRGRPSMRHRCNHPVAVLVDPTDQQLQELETMLSGCPNCNRWRPGDGPIMAVLTSRAIGVSDGPAEFM